MDPRAKEEVKIDDGKSRRLWVRSLFGKIPWRRAWQCIPVFLPGESHGQRNLMAYSPQGSQGLDRTEAT